MKREGGISKKESILEMLTMGGGDVWRVRREGYTADCVCYRGEDITDCAHLDSC